MRRRRSFVSRGEKSKSETLPGKKRLRKPRRAKERMTRTRSRAKATMTFRMLMHRLPPLRSLTTRMTIFQMQWDLRKIATMIFQKQMLGEPTTVAP